MGPAAIHVVIPCYRGSATILEVLAGIGPLVSGITVVDDACPEQSGKRVLAHCTDARVQVLFHEANQGVGGACITGFRAARERGATCIVKMDADGQMDPELIPALVDPLLRGEADYVKGNRFWDLAHLLEMPRMRLFGNAVLSFLSKASSGYWELMDPTNGYIAFNARLLDLLPLERISRRYFFESDMLFRLNTVRAVVHEIPMGARYRGEQSQMQLARMPMHFLRNHAVRVAKRIFYNYFLRDFSIASLELVCGLVLLAAGMVYGGSNWHANAGIGRETPTGVIMVTMLLLITGFQLLLAFLSYDMTRGNSVPVSRSP